jgi:hypothetical protein
MTPTNQTDSYSFKNIMLIIFVGNKVLGTLQNSSHMADPSASFAIRHSETALDPAGPLVVRPYR